jgi:hypothetical protein
MSDITLVSLRDCAVFVETVYLLVKGFIHSMF